MLVNCVAYQEGKKLTDIPKQEIGAYVRRPDCFVGVALRDAVELAENETTKKLASCAALLAIPTLIADIYGMSFTDMPEIHWSFRHPLCLGVLVAVDVALFYRFREIGWI